MILTLPRITGLIVILSCIWFAAPFFEIKGIAPFATISTRLILCLIVILAISLLIVIEWLINKQKQTAEEQAQKAELSKQKLAYKKAMQRTTIKLFKLFPLWRWRKLC